MDKYIKLDTLGKGSQGNDVRLVKHLEENKVTSLNYFFKIEICNEEDFYRCK